MSIIVFGAVGPVGAGPGAFSPIRLVPSPIPASAPFRRPVPGLSGGIAIPSGPPIPTAGPSSAPARRDGPVWAAIPTAGASVIILDMNGWRASGAGNASRGARHCDNRDSGSRMRGCGAEAGDRSAGDKPEYFHDRLKPLCKTNRNSPPPDHSEIATWRNREVHPAKLQP